MNEWITVMTFTYPHEAHMVKGYLESCGISVFLKDELTAQVYNFNSNAIGGVKLQVMESDLKEGLKLLKDGGYLKEPDTGDQFDLVQLTPSVNRSVCPFCHSENIARKKEPNLLVVVFYFIFGAFFPIFRSSYQCFECGKIWKFVRRL